MGHDPGIDAEDESALFERLPRGSASRGGPGGTGLGLAIVRTLAHRWRGDAHIANRPEGGARAEVLLPVSEAAKQQRNEALTGAASVEGLGLRSFLIVVGLGLVGLLAAASIGFASYYVSRDWLIGSRPWRRRD